MKKIFMQKKYYKVLFYITVVAVFIIAISPSGQSNINIANLDKILHAIAFFVLSLELNRASSTIEHRIRNMSALLTFGIFIEIAQSFTPTRESSVNDVLADLVGILLFQLFYSLLRAYKYRKKS
jgi:VanZ family protein